MTFADLLNQKTMQTKQASTLKTCRFLLVPTFILIALQSLLSCSANQAHAQEVDWRKRFVQEAPAKWSELRAKMSKLQGTSTERRSLYVSGVLRKALAPERTEIKQRPNSVLYYWRQIGAAPAEQAEENILVANPRYHFELRRRGPNAPWVITTIRRISDSDDESLKTERSLQSPYFWFEMTMATPYSLMPIHPKIPPFGSFADNGFIVKDAFPIQDANTKLIKVVFEFDLPGKQTKSLLKKGWIACDPNNYWIIRKAQLYVDRGRPELGVLSVTNEYRESESDYPIIQKHLSEETYRKSGEKAVRQRVYDLHKGEPGQAQFTLSAFGFPEPFGMELRPTPWYIWAGVIGIVCLLASGFFLWLKQRGLRAS